MKVFIGLGNIGEEYEKTPHNAGFMFVDATYNFLEHISTADCGGCMCAFKGKFATGRLTDWKNEKIFEAEMAKMKSDTSETLYLLAKPTTLMNLSGNAVNKIVDKLEIDIKEDLYIAYDDLDIKLGDYKISDSKSPHDHKGIQDVIKKLGTSEFTHIRLGIDNRDNKISGKKYVLKKYSEKELDILYQVIVESISQILN